MPSSGVWRRVDVIDWTDVSEDRIASIYRVATCSRWFFDRGFFYPVDGGDTILRNVGSIDHIYTAPHLRRRHSSYAVSLQYCPSESVNIYLEDGLFSSRRLSSYLVSVSGALGLHVLMGFKLDLLLKAFEGFLRRIFKSDTDFSHWALAITSPLFSFCPLTTSLSLFFYNFMNVLCL
jgi:hypothetical protein